MTEVVVEKCKRCGAGMVRREGQFGPFLACSKFPECKNTLQIKEKVGAFCPECRGEMVKNKTKAGKTFYGCENYPTCKFATWGEPVAGKLCSNCKSMLVKNGKMAKCVKCEKREYLKSN